VIEGDPDEPLTHPDNVILTEFDIPIDPPRPAKEAGMDLTYTYDTDGILRIDVVDASTGATITEGVTVAFQGARDPKDLVAIAGRVRDAVDGGTVASSPVIPTTTNPRSAELITRARSKVMPFIEDDEASESMPCSAPGCRRTRPPSMPRMPGPPGRSGSRPSHRA
jgi:hypothetical protein